MGYRLELTKTAESELRSAIERLAGVFGSPNSAAKLLNEFKCLEPVLSTFPRYKPVFFPACKTFGIEVRKAQVKNYLAYYTINDESKTVTVISILAMRQDQLANLVRDYSFFS